MLNHGYHFPIILFQSLFWWILLLNSEIVARYYTCGEVSILVLVDFALKPFILRLVTKAIAFQSLFWWILLLNALLFIALPV